MSGNKTLKEIFFYYLKKLGKVYPTLMVIKLFVHKKGRMALIYNYNNVDNKVGFILCMSALLLIGFILLLFLSVTTSYIFNRFKNWRQQSTE